MSRNSSSRSDRGFTLVEMMLSMALLCVIMGLLNSMLGVTRNIWQESRTSVDTFQSGRTALELLARELAPAVVDTRTQFAVVPGKVLADAGADLVGSDRPAVLWMAPQGQSGALTCLGYYLSRDPSKGRYRLERLCITPKLPDGTTDSPWFPKLSNPLNSKLPGMTTDPYSASWFTTSWKANPEIFDDESLADPGPPISTAADGVIAFWVQCLDLLGHPIPPAPNNGPHPGATPLLYNSAAYFEVATSTPFDDASSFAYVNPGPQAMKGNRVPAQIVVTIALLDADSIKRVSAVPEQQEITQANGALDLDKSVATFQADLKTAGIFRARFFTTHVRLVNGT